MRGGKRENSGRKKGTPNRTTEEMRELIKGVLEKNILKIHQDLEQMKPEQRVKAIIDLSKFVIPTLKATELSSDKEKTVTISFID